MNVECPACLGNKETFTGEDYEKCTFCEGKGNVTKIKSLNFDPIADIKYDETIEENFDDDYQDTE